MTRIQTAAYAAIVSLLPATGIAFAGEQPTPAAGQGQAHAVADKQMPDKQMSAEQMVATWPAAPQKAFKETMEKYGQPTGVTPTRLVWTDKGPFKEIILLNQEFQHDFPVAHKDCLEHVVEYKVPMDKVGDLAKFDGSVIVDRTRGTIGARCDSEAHNLLALNLANDIITGKRNVEEARAAYADAVKQEMMGKPTSYAQKLQFEPQRNTGDTDMAAAPGRAAEAQPASSKETPDKR